jgi:hypothetical protein
MNAFKTYDSARGPNSQPHSLKETEKKFKIMKLQQTSHKLLDQRPQLRSMEAIKYHTLYFENITKSITSLFL